MLIFPLALDVLRSANLTIETHQTSPRTYSIEAPNGDRLDGLSRDELCEHATNVHDRLESNKA